MLAIQEYINLFPNIKKANKHLAEDLHIRVKRQELLVPIDELEEAASEIAIGIGAPEVVYIYNYHPTKSPRGNSIVEECNGLILNKDAEIVSVSFPRIYSASEKCAPEMEWERARAELRADGTLVVIFNYKDKWFIQTKTDVHAVEPMKKYKISIRIGVITVLDAMFEDKRGPFYPFENCGNRDLCYVFEFVSP
jgi:hypothetical protein